MNCLGNRHEDHAGLFQLLAEGRGNRDRIEHRIDGNAGRFACGGCGFCRAFDTEQNFSFAQRDTELFVGFENFLRNVVNRLILRAGFGGGVVVVILIIDGRIIDHRPGRLFHGQPAPIGR